MSYNYKTLTNPSSFFIIPGWLYRTIVKNKLNLIDTIDYRKLRKVLSINDLAEIFLLNSCSKNNPFDFLHSGQWVNDRDNVLNFFFDASTVNTEELAEIEKAIIPLSQSPEIISGVVNRFKEIPQYQGVPQTAGFVYNYIPANNRVIFVILNEGITQALYDKEFKLCFLRDCLKQQYSVDTVPQVSNNETFKQYISLLQSMNLD